ncbi:unnamed protein product [Dibothriocephalus latus]|uniref:Uncharacterized protein n=1 Tax=Dibothriocephalus latus TaxID=60516 RepID=A0A3P7P803_DIBLA|nr:unnamed protein product [Dibothriocephalus latus]
MTSEVNVEQLEISKNLLQMNFMRRTLLAKERATGVSVQEPTLQSVECEFFMPDSAMKRLSETLDALSKSPVVRHTADCGRPASVYLRASYNGFNPHLTALLNNDPSAAPSSLPTKPKEEAASGKQKQRKLLASYKRHSQGMFVYLQRIC